MDERIARLHTHQKNIDRYRRLLETELTEFERQYLEKRLSEEQSATKTLFGSIDSPFDPSARATTNINN
jgi:hypothetical protein